MQNKKTFYITTPIFYPNDNMHIGHCYTTVACDVVTKYKKLKGFDTLFLTGTDEHGQKIEKTAKENGKEPLEYVNKIVEDTKKLWERLDINYDVFSRTTNPSHKEAVYEIFKTLYDKGDIYKDNYDGLYCTPCESFISETKAKETGGTCPDCGRETEKIKEEVYFFDLPKYLPALKKHIEDNENFISPNSRKNEMLNLLKETGPLCVSRTTFKWGVQVKFDEDHIIYVWIDALSNYITNIGDKYDTHWPADIHMVGKDIVRFHTIIWPAILMALDKPLPRQIFGHGFFNIEGDKISKSKGNSVEPNFLIDRYGSDSIRYFLMREMQGGSDADFKTSTFLNRINFDLANDLGNLISRSLSMATQNFEDGLLEEHEKSEFDEVLKEYIRETVDNVDSCMESLMFAKALEHIWNLVRRTNKYIDETTPWILARENEKAKLSNVLYMLFESLRSISILISPFIPKTAKYLEENIGFTIQNFDEAKTFGILKKNISVKKGEILFPRIDVKKEETELEELFTKKTKKEDYIKIDDFAKVQIKVGTVLECNKVSKSDKLLLFKLQIGNEVRQIFSGIAKHYNPEELIGKQVIAITNLAPRKMMGAISEGMILSAEDSDGSLSLLTLQKQIKDGAEVK